ncbi:hypothetical protein ACFS5L_06145 [Streptomyces phyllanthi]|uniref:Uncharacterized protein n=1 Tax=Streptomyces phyllanthi TaxID=1803180 RepID=A0A5N8VY05_9ACTN|nr:hypothetical protein [Streptomyces phyllanthi]MPY40151.1 hypothetical protein [Streptomyces phyllanthi]
MSTSPTPDLWRLSAVLLVSSVAVTFVVSAVLDVLAARARNRRVRQRPSVGPTSDVTVTDKASALEDRAVPSR